MKINYIIFCLLTGLVFSFTSHAQNYIINTVAGNGIVGYSGDGGAATAAQLNDAYRVATDDSGNIYIADWTNSRVRKVNTHGIISTIAGTGNYGYSGDGGPATLAKLSYPYGITLDKYNNLYVCDEHNNVIRKITANGIITTIAGNGILGYSGDGGQATDAELYYPGGISVDTSGNIFVAEVGNSVIRKINTAGIISTFAGTGTTGFSGDGGPASQATLNGPNGVLATISGIVYFTDFWNNRIRMVNTGGIISTIAGNGISGYAGDGGAATAAKMCGPDAIVEDKSGNIFFCDAVNNVVRKINSGSIISTIAGTGYDAGTGNGSYSGDGGPATAAELWDPNGIALDDSGDIYIADAFNYRIRKLTTPCLSAINIYPPSPVICKGQGVTLIASGNGTAYSWSPESGLSATIGDSVVATPTATITYTVTSLNSCTTTATDIITVTPAPNKPTISVSVTGDTLFSSTQNGNHWFLNGQLVHGATDSFYIIKGLSDDTFEVEVTNVANGCSATSDLLVSTGINQLSAIHEQSSIYPNPNNGNFTIQLPNIKQNTQLEIFNVLGEKIYTTKLNSTITLLNLNHQPSGIYLYRILDEKGIIGGEGRFLME